MFGSKHFFASTRRLKRIKCLNAQVSYNQTFLKKEEVSKRMFLQNSIFSLKKKSSKKSLFFFKNSFLKSFFASSLLVTENLTIFHFREGKKNKTLFFKRLKKNKKILTCSKEKSFFYNSSLTAKNKLNFVKDFFKKWRPLVATPKIYFKKINSILKKSSSGKIRNFYKAKKLVFLKNTSHLFEKLNNKKFFPPPFTSLLLSESFSFPTTFPPLPCYFVAEAPKKKEREGKGKVKRSEGDKAGKDKEEAKFFYINHNFPSLHLLLKQKKVSFFKSYFFSLFSIPFKNRQIHRFIYFCLFSKKSENLFFSTFTKSFSVFYFLDIFLFSFLYVWAQKQHNKNSNSWIFNKYWLFLQPLPYFFYNKICIMKNKISSKKKKSILISRELFFFTSSFAAVQSTYADTAALPMRSRSTDALLRTAALPMPMPMPMGSYFPRCCYFPLASSLLLPCRIASKKLFCRETNRGEIRCFERNRGKGEGKETLFFYKPNRSSIFINMFYKFKLPPLLNQLTKTTFTEKKVNDFLKNPNKNLKIKKGVLKTWYLENYKAKFALKINVKRKQKKFSFYLKKLKLLKKIKFNSFKLRFNQEFEKEFYKKSLRVNDSQTLEYKEIQFYIVKKDRFYYKKSKIYQESIFLNAFFDQS